MSEKNYLLYKFVQHLVPVYPVYLLLFESKGLSVQQISLLLAIWSFPLVILEIPTGILADNWSRKKLLVMGSMQKALAYFIWLFADGFWLFAAGFVLWGTAGAFVSGTEQALLYDSLKSDGKESSFDRVYGKGNYYESIAVAVSCLSGGFLAAWFGMGFVLVLSVASMAVCTIITLGFREANCYKEGKAKTIKESLGTLKQALRLCIGNKLLLAVISLSVLAIGVSGMLDEYDSLIADRFGLNLGFVGLWMSLRHVLEAIGGRIAFRLKQVLAFLGVRDGFEKVGLVCIAAAIMLGLSGWAGTIAAMPLYGLFYLLMASASVIHEDYVQQSIEEEGRSTVHSIISLAGNLYAMVFYNIFALILAGTGMLPALVLVAVYIIILCSLIGIIYALIKRTTAI